MTTSPIEVMLLTVADLPVLERVDPDVFDNPVQPALAAQYLSNPGNLLAVAIQEGVVVGMATAMAYVHPDKPLQLFINEVGVSERCQRQGVGGRLMQTLLEQGNIMGCSEAWVATEESNASARAFYAATQGAEDEVHAVVFTWKLQDGLEQPSGLTHAG